MTGIERVTNTILGKPVDRQPLYGWVYWNMQEKIDSAYGSLAEFEKRYEFDLVHLFSGPACLNKDLIDRIREEHDGELTPDMLVNEEIFISPEIEENYDALKADLKKYRDGEKRFCYLQTPGFLEQFNDVFGIENHLMYLLLYPDEIRELYRRQVEWTVKASLKAVSLGVDMIHISDDWGAQRSLLLSPALWRELIFPNMKKVVDAVHQAGAFVSLHSDGCIADVLDGIAELGFDLIHPYQENANMPYSLYLDHYADRFAIMGGINIQNALGILPREALEKEIRRVFSLLSGKRWVVCTTHFVQEHCSIEDLKFAYDLIYRLIRGEA